MKLGACDFLTKPFDPDHLGIVIQKALERESLKREVTHLRSDLGARYSTIVAASVKMKDVVTSAKRAAATGAIIYLLRVMVNESVDPPVVVTVYRTNKIAKYWRKP